MCTEDEELAHEFAQASSLYGDAKYAEAFLRYIDLAKRGYSDCQTFVGWMYLVGKGVEKDAEQSKYWFLKAVEADDAEAEFYLGKLEANSGNYTSAFGWYKKSASHNYLPSFYQLAVMYDKGRGVGEDEERAISLYEEAAKMGHVYAKKAYAVKLLRGKRGFSNILKGLVFYIVVGLRAIKIAKRDMYDERLRV